MFIMSRTRPWLLALSFGLLSITAVNAATQCAQGGEFRCMIDPCMVSDCPGVPQATCEPNFCGGCNAEFFMNGIQVLASDCQDGSGASALTNKASSSSSSTSALNKRQPVRPKIPVFGTPPGAGNDLGGMFPEQPPLSPPVDLIDRLSSINVPNGLQEELELLMGGGGGGGGRNLNRDTRSSFRSGSRRNQRGGSGSNRPPFLGGSRGTEFIPGGNRGTETFPRGNRGNRPPFLSGSRGTVFVPPGSRGTENISRGNRSNRPPFLGGNRGTEFIPGGNGGNRPPFLDGRSSRFPRPSANQQRSRSSQRSSSSRREGRGGRQSGLNNFFRNFFGSNGRP